MRVYPWLPASNLTMQKSVKSVEAAETRKKYHEKLPCIVDVMASC